MRYLIIIALLCLSLPAYGLTVPSSGSKDDYRPDSGGAEIKDGPGYNWTLHIVLAAIIIIVLIIPAGT